MPRLADLIPEVRTHLSSAPEPTVTLYLRRAAQEFARKSQVWRQSIGTKDLLGADIDGDEDYTAFTLPSTDFALPDESQIWDISRVTLDDEDLDGFGYDLETATLSIVSDELDTETLEVFATLEPTDGANRIPSALARWHVGITSHAISEMMLMPKEPWSAPRLAPVFERKFHDQVGRANLVRAKKRTKKPLRTKRFEFL